MSVLISSLVPSTLIENKAVAVHVQGETGRISLRARGDLAALNKAIGLDLPNKIGLRSQQGPLEALCLGPDEWTLVMPSADVDAVMQACATIYPDHPHSATVISAREITLSIQGPLAADLLSIGCPRDLTTIKPGQARRTVFDGTTVVLWCDSADQYRMDVWNSFAPYVADLLVTGAKELATEQA